MLREKATAVLLLLMLVPLSAILASPCWSASEPDGDFQFVQTGAGLTLHKDLFALPYTYADEYRGRRTETVFQISAKYRLFDTGLYLAYTQISFWQSYDYRNSSPFRDTNYNPEIFYRFQPRACRSGRLAADAGIEHESNGQLVPLSRSWNNVYFAPWYQRGDLLFYAKLRYRIPEPVKTSPDDAEGDDNPDITDYLGHSDVHVFYRFAGRHQIHLTMRGVIGSGRGNVSLGYSCPLPRAEGSHLMVRLSHGYGESLMDYRNSISRVGIGFMFTR
jgi:phospholipase A1/A2